MKEESKALIAGVLTLVLLGIVVISVLAFIGFNLPEWNGWTE
jgi:hypothetical protein